MSRTMKVVLLLSVLCVAAIALSGCGGGGNGGSGGSGAKADDPHAALVGTWYTTTADPVVKWEFFADGNAEASDIGDSIKWAIGSKNDKPVIDVTGGGGSGQWDYTLSGDTLTMRNVSYARQGSPEAKASEAKFNDRAAKGACLGGARNQPVQGFISSRKAVGDEGSDLKYLDGKSYADVYQAGVSEKFIADSPENRAYKCPSGGEITFHLVDDANGNAELVPWCTVHGKWEL